MSHTHSRSKYHLKLVCTGSLSVLRNSAELCSVDIQHFYNIKTFLKHQQNSSTYPSLVSIHHCPPTWLSFKWCFFSLLPFLINSCHCDLWKWLNESQIWSETPLLQPKHHMFLKSVSNCDRSSSLWMNDPCVLLLGVCVSGMSFSVRAFLDSGSRSWKPTLWCEKPTFWQRRWANWLTIRSPFRSLQPTSAPTARSDLWTHHTPPRHQLTRGYCVPSCKVWNVRKISKSVNVLFLFSVEL